MPKFDAYIWQIANLGMISPNLLFLMFIKGANM